MAMVEMVASFGYIGWPTKNGNLPLLQMSVALTDLDCTANYPATHWVGCGSFTHTGTPRSTRTLQSSLY